MADTQFSAYLHRMFTTNEGFGIHTRRLRSGILELDNIYMIKENFMLYSDSQWKESCYQLHTVNVNP
jgi:hypothetical protein